MFLDEPMVMGILNVTPDSFYDGGTHTTDQKILLQGQKMLEEGAAFIDVGGYSSRPGADNITEDEEMGRVIPAIGLLVKEFGEAIISVDTFRAGVARAAVETGASIINDISAGKLDSDMHATIAELGVPYIAMHMPGTPQTMQQHAHYADVVNDLILYFSEVVGQLRSLGVADILLDPGFGFGKKQHHNYELLSRLKELQLLEYPIVAGVSRKSMLYQPLNINASEALNATTAAHVVALQNGAHVLRAHDVLEAVQAIKIYNLARTSSTA